MRDYANANLWGSGVLMQVVGLSDIGLIRPRNEDSFYINKQAGIFIICDGMGGHKGGDVASNMAIDTIVAETLAHKELNLDLLNEAIRKANYKIWLEGLNNSDLHEMGTTISLASITDMELNICHVGDSRIYLIRKNQITQLTKDHTLAEKMRERGISETEQKSYKHVLTRALGINDKVEIDNLALGLQMGDLILLCSDGLSDMLSDQELLNTIKIKNEIETIGRNLIKKAISKGGRDNITLILIQI